MLGVAGVDGNGQAELELTLTGLAVPERGTSRSTAPTSPDCALVSALPLASPTSRRTSRSSPVGSMRCDDNLTLGRTRWSSS